jgi:hypothetical protein
MTTRLQSFLPRSRSKVVFALVMACYCITLTYFAAACRRAVRIQSPPPAFYAGYRQQPVEHAFELLLFAPIVESLILVAVFELVRRSHAPAVVQVLAAAAFVSELHVWPWWPHAIIVMPAFCIDAGSYLYWRSRGPWKTAFIVVASIHALSNSISAVATLGYAFQKV